MPLAESSPVDRRRAALCSRAHPFRSSGCSDSSTGKGVGRDGTLRACEGAGVQLAPSLALGRLLASALKACSPDLTAERRSDLRTFAKPTPTNARQYPTPHQEGDS